ncbi:MAG: acyl-homoserine-lactone synthase [Pseudomonadota bacterium]
MRSITFDMSTMHRHGSAFYDFLRLRKSFFVDGLGWQVPTDGTVEMDQYDTPLAQYSVVVKGDRVVGGARCQPSTTTWGSYTNMLNDASNGILRGIPEDLFSPELCAPDTWEGTRLVVSGEIKSTQERLQCLALAIDGLMRIIGARGGRAFYTISPVPLQRTATLLGVNTERLSRIYLSETDGREYAVFLCHVERAINRMRELGIDPDTHEVVPDRLSRVG